MRLPRFALPILAALMGATVPVQAQDATHAGRIRAIERGLMPAQVLRGQPIPRFGLRERMEEWHVPGVSVAVIDSGRIVWARAWGARRAGGTEPVDTATLFQAASISKPVAALAALSLVEEGRLDLDEDVNARLRSWSVPGNGFTAQEKVTLRRLLSHTAGLTVHGFRGYARGEAVPSLTQVLDGVDPANSAAVRADTVPGTFARYSGGGFTVAQLLMMDVTGKPFSELLRERVLDPLDMQRSTYAQPLPEELAANAAVGHRSDGSAVAGEWHTYPEQAAAGLWTTPSDLARVVIEVQRAWHGQSNRVLSSAMTRTMLTRNEAGTALGFGVMAGDDPAFGHGGANEGYRANVFAYRDRGQGAVVMTNGDDGDALASEILRAISDAYGWPGWKPRERERAPVDAVTLQSLTGTYVLEEDRVIEVAVDGDALRVTFTGRDADVFHPAPDGRWFSLNGGPELEFDRSRSPAPAVLVHGIAPEPVTARRRNQP